MLNNSDAWISCGFICLSGKNSIVYEACVSAKTSMGSAAPTQQGAGGGLCYRRTYACTRSLSLLRACAQSSSGLVPAPLPLSSGLRSPSRLAPEATAHTRHRGAGRGARGARRAARLPPLEPPLLPAAARGPGLRAAWRRVRVTRQSVSDEII